MSSIAVCIRLRPYLPQQKTQKSQRQRMSIQQQSQNIKVELTEQRQKVFKFNNVFGPEVNQDELYAKLETVSMVERVVEGYHSTIFAYGQTGSGKTYTIEGGDQTETEGLVPKAIRDLFRVIEDKSSADKGYRVFVSFVQIYNESIFDLIDNNDGKPLKMRWNKLQQFTVENIFEGQCRSAEEALRWWRKGQKNKVMGSHKMNNTSSRSHCLLTLRVKSYLLEDPSEQVESKLQIVDLAGSERHKATKSTGVVFKEGIQINKSLFALRQVIASLYQSSTSGKSSLLPPYRDSKLTSLLKQSIGGNSYCLMIACLNPTMTHFEESLQTLTYASMATYINNLPTKNIDPKVKQNIQLKQQNHQLQQQLHKLEDHIEYLTKLLENNECPECQQKKVLRKTGPQLCKASQEMLEAEEPTGILSKNELLKEKILLAESANEVKKNGLERTYQKLLKQRNNNAGNRTLKSTKEIIESIGMIRDLISANSALREKIQSLKNHVECQQRETFTLMKENQVLRDRWDMISGNIKAEAQATTQEAPIATYERLMREQKGEGLKLGSLHSQNSRFQKLDSEGTHSKMSYNDFLRGGKKLANLKSRSDYKRKNRIHSEAKRIGHDSFY